MHGDAYFAQVPAPYEGFDAEAAVQILKDAGFQMASCFARRLSMARWVGDV
ncbi:MAG TPA: hypothetical protein VNY05_16405 [Candidatus Acidoferrales bacterium]|nr:hypothetical protein [Candidatus Acidoferrales bacterium]